MSVFSSRCVNGTTKALSNWSLAGLLVWFDILDNSLLCGLRVLEGKKIACGLRNHRPVLINNNAQIAVLKDNFQRYLNLPRGGGAVRLSIGTRNHAEC